MTLLFGVCVVINSRLTANPAVETAVALGRMLVPCASHKSSQLGAQIGTAGGWGVCPVDSLLHVLLCSALLCVLFFSSPSAHLPSLLQLPE